MALHLASRGLGQVWPNPAVGCVLVRQDNDRTTVVGQGWTQRGGRPHAETVAIDGAGELANGATAYVSLEPCSHHGKTGPCTEALIKAGISRVVVASEDPDPRVSGQGITRLREAGIEVASGYLEREARRLNQGFFSHIERQRPYVALKLAISLDGKIAACDGTSQWITGEKSRDYAHWLRAIHDAVLVGSETVLADNPQLTCRLSGLADRSPVRVVLDRRLRIPIDSKLVDSAGAVPLWIVTSERAAKQSSPVLDSLGIDFLLLSEDAQKSNMMSHVLARLAERGITRLLVEGGSKIAGALLSAKLVDKLYLFQAPIILGGDAVSAFELDGLGAPDKAPRWHAVAERHFGPDLLRVYEYNNDRRED